MKTCQKQEHKLPVDVYGSKTSLLKLPIVEPAAGWRGVVNCEVKITEIPHPGKWLLVTAWTKIQYPYPRDRKIIQMPYLQPGQSNQSKSRPMPHLPPPPAGLTLIGLLCSSRKYPCPPQGRLMEIPRGRGVSKAQIYEGKYDTKMEFPEGWEGSILKTFRGRGMDLFWNNTF